MNKLNLKWVSDTIGNDYEYWNPGDTVLIQAQTGTGKTWFIQNVLLDHMSSHEKLLLVCNRTNLKRQLKKDLLRKYRLPIPEKIEELDKITTIDKITITSYHAISNSIQDEIYGKGKSDFNMYDYIVFDECHFIFSDGSFNNKTRFCFEKIVKEYYHNKIKIFISATMHEIKGQIIKNVERVQNNGFVLDAPSIHEYTTGTDYSYVNPYYFKRLDSIINTIKNDKSDEKWLIFISDLKEGKEILKSLGEEKCSLVKAGTKDNDDLNSIISESKFNKKVLICTKTLDNGINLFDSTLKNIVIMAWDQITFIQMLGRKRIDIENPEQINLFMQLRYKKSFRSKLKKYNKKEDEIKLLNKDSNSFYRKYDNDLKFFKDMDDVFYRSIRTGEIKVNTIGYKRLKLDIDFSEYMINQFEDVGEFAFIHEQLKWLGLKDDEPEKRYLGEVIVEDEINKLEKHLNSIVGLKLFSDEQQEISDLIIKELITLKPNTDYRTKKLKPSTLESIIRVQLGLPYAVSKPKQESSGTNKGRRYIIITEIK